MLFHDALIVAVNIHPHSQSSLQLITKSKESN